MSKTVHRQQEEMQARLSRLSPHHLDLAKKMLVRLEECQRQREAGLDPPLPVFDDLLSQAEQ